MQILASGEKTGCGWRGWDMAVVGNLPPGIYQDGHDFVGTPVAAGVWDVLVTYEFFTCDGGTATSTRFPGERVPVRLTISR